MTSTFSTNLNLQLQGTSDNSNTWGSILNSAVFANIDLAAGGTYNANVAGNTDFTPSATNALNLSHILTGVLTGNINYIFPASCGRFLLITNSTTGAFTVTVKSSGGTGVVVTQGTTQLVYINNVTNTASIPLPITSTPFTDASALVKNASDATKLAILSAASISTATTRTYTLPDISDTLATIAATQTFTNKTYDTAGTGNVFKINGTAISAVTGTGSVVLSASPTFTGTPTLPTGTIATTQSPGDNTTKVATTAFTAAAVAAIGTSVFTKSFISSQQTLTSAGLLTLAHSLGTTPLFVTTTIVCQSSEAGFSTNDEVTVSLYAPNAASGTVNEGGIIYWDSTNVYVRFTSQTAIFAHIGNKGTGADASLTNANWKLVVRAFA